MTHHETFALLAAKRISEPLSAQEEADLEEHLAACPACRSLAAGMRRDAVALHTELADREVAPRVRRRVMHETEPGRQLNKRLLLGLAAILLLAAIGGPFLAGSRFATAPSSSPAQPSPTVALVASSSPSPTLGSPTPSAPGLSPSPTGPGAFVVAAYTYAEKPPRGGTVAAHFEERKPVGEWSRREPATGAGEFYGGPITCLVVDGSDAWLAGPATTATDGTERAALVYLHDGGPERLNDEVVFWLTPKGQTLTTVEDWCVRRFLPASPSPITKGDITVVDGP